MSYMVIQLNLNKNKKKKEIKAWERERERIGQKKIMIPAEMFKLLLSNTLNLN